MKLYFSPGACSLASHIILREAGLPVALEQVDTSTHKTAQGVDYYTINPRGTVPLLELDNGERLSEGPIIAQFLADTAKNTNLMPAAGTLARYRVMEWQNFITSELHKSFSPLFGRPELDAAGRAQFVDALRKKFRWVSSQLEGKQYLTGDTFTAADAYLFVVSNWAVHVDVDLSEFTALQEYRDRIAARPAVKEALKVEGLI